jgi:hypothetical protein
MGFHEGLSEGVIEVRGLTETTQRNVMGDGNPPHSGLPSHRTPS